MNSGEVVIRRVKPKDEAAIARLWQALSDYHAVIDPRLPAAVPGAAERYAARLVERRNDAQTQTFVAVVDGDVVGYVLGAVIDLHPDLFEQVDAGFIADIFVDSSYRHHGIARQLVTTINAWFAKKGAPYVEWQVAALNSDGVRFWESMGGQPVMTRMRMDIGSGDASSDND